MDTQVREQLGAAIKMTQAIAEAIRELGEVPSGHLYAIVIGQVTMEQYARIIDVLKGAGLVEEKNHVLKWAGPTLVGGAR